MLPEPLRSEYEKYKVCKNDSSMGFRRFMNELSFYIPDHTFVALYYDIAAIKQDLKDWVRALSLNKNKRFVTPSGSEMKAVDNKILSIIRDDFSCQKCGSKAVLIVESKYSDCSRYSTFNFICENLDPLTADHIIPRAKKGATHINNFQSYCYNCNHSKSDRCDITEFSEWLHWTDIERVFKNNPYIADNIRSWYHRKYKNINQAILNAALRREDMIEYIDSFKLSSNYIDRLHSLNVYYTPKYERGYFNI